MIYEDSPGCPAPPLAPLPPWHDVGFYFTLMGIADRPLSRLVARAAFALSGFRRFYRRLPHTIDGLLRSTNLRPTNGPLTQSATLALTDDQPGVAPLLRAGALVKAVVSSWCSATPGRASS